MTIKSWPANERPREKLLLQGPSVLSDSELLAIFLRTGTQGQSAVDLARSLLQEYGSLRAILEASQQRFCASRGLGSAKFAQLQAVLEMARRHLAQTLEQGQVLNSSNCVKRFLTAQLRHKHHEVFAALFLDNQHRLLKYEELFTGTIDSSSVYPREIVKKVMQYNAAAVIFAHNHPSGVAEPSSADAHITRHLKQALDLIDVRTLDHLVVGDGEVVSLAERGVI